MSESYLARQSRVEMFQKPQPVFGARTLVVSYRPELDANNELVVTDFEEDLSDQDDFSARRSEHSTGEQSATTVSSVDEINTPETAPLSAFDAFNFQLEPVAVAKAVQGPVGPHLFRISQGSTDETELDMTHELDLSMVMADSPKQHPPRPTEPVPAQTADVSLEETPLTKEALKRWTPRQVAEWMRGQGFERVIIDQFFTNDIAGLTLLDLQYDDLKELGITSFGQRHRLWAEIRGLKESVGSPCPSPSEHSCLSAMEKKLPSILDSSSRACSSPETPEEKKAKSPSRRHRKREDDEISPAESASIVAIEQMLPRPHSCSKGEACSKWRRQQRKLAAIATEFPLEFAQISSARNSPMRSGASRMSIIVPSLVASSDVLGPALPPVRLQEDNLRVVQARDPQENVRQFLNFQHLHQQPSSHSPITPPYEMFPQLSPQLSPPFTQPPHSHLKNLPRLTIPYTPPCSDVTTLSPNRTAIPRDTRTHANGSYIYRLGSPASEIDVPVTAIHTGPIPRDFSSSVPPDMRYGSTDVDLIPRTASRASFRFAPMRAASHLGHRANPQGYSMAAVLEDKPEPSSGYKITSIATSTASPHPDIISPVGDLTPTTAEPPQPQHAGWMKKRRTRILRHEWQDSHFRLTGRTLAMHRDATPEAPALDRINVDEYAVACNSLASGGKLNAAFKRLALGSGSNNGSSGKNALSGGVEGAAFGFQLVPQARAGESGREGKDFKRVLVKDVGKTHHFAVRSSEQRIDWMREILVSKAKMAQKGAVHEGFHDKERSYEDGMT